MEGKLVDFKKITIRCVGVDDEHAVGLVASVMAEGLVSQTRGVKHYCHATRFTSGPFVYCVLTRDNNLVFHVVTEHPHG